jgi:hypothetical protein
MIEAHGAMLMLSPRRGRRLKYFFMQNFARNRPTLFVVAAVGGRGFFFFVTL